MLEQDRYQQSPKLYTFGMIVLMLFWLFTLVGLYIVPFLIWGLHYDVPELVIAMEFFIQEEFGLSLTVAKWLTFLSFAVPAIICFMISTMVSTRIDKKLVLKQELEERTSVPITEAPHKEQISVRPIGQEMSLATKIFLLMLLAVVILFTIEWLISVPTPEI